MVYFFSSGVEIAINWVVYGQQLSAPGNELQKEDLHRTQLYTYTVFSI